MMSQSLVKIKLESLLYQIWVHSTTVGFFLSLYLVIGHYFKNFTTHPGSPTSGTANS